MQHCIPCLPEEVLQRCVHRVRCHLCNLKLFVCIGYSQERRLDYDCLPTTCPCMLGWLTNVFRDQIKKKKENKISCSRALIPMLGSDVWNETPSQFYGEILHFNDNHCFWHLLFLWILFWCSSVLAQDIKNIFVQIHRRWHSQEVNVITGMDIFIWANVF